MTTELYWLTLTVLMTALFWVPYVLNRMVVSGLGGTLAGTSPTSEGHSAWANRAINAHHNAIENLAIFAPIVLTAHVLNISNGATKAAVVIYFFARLVHFEDLKLHAEGPSHVLRVFQEGCAHWIAWIAEVRYAGNPRRNLLQQLHPLPEDFFSDQHGDSGDVASRPREARHDPGAYRITPSDHDDRNRLSRTLRHQRCCRRPDDHDIYLEADKFGDQLGITLGLAVSVSVLDGDVLALDVAEITETLPECRGVWLGWRGRFGWEQDSDPRHLPGLLSPRGERRKNNAESENDREPDQPHGHLV